ncbi:energy transducer TonB [Cognatilysobacter segetis]|uniref:energy transducer TonB n=1 Tax=Cognatilysobacter segetis TaxID=2492394 RepID=UPI001061E2FB|nr:energy transducer TonB [Lysobacter segetis]
MRALAIVPLVLLLAACDGGTPAPATPVGRSGPPAAVETPPPTYPEALACAGVGGTVQLRVNIGTDGAVGEVQIQQSSGNADLDQVAAKAVRDWKFRPAMQAGTPVAKWIAVPMTFHVPQPRPDHCFVLDEQAGGSAPAK